jgi:hypothetical protein
VGQTGFRVNLLPLLFIELFGFPTGIASLRRKPFKPKVASSILVGRMGRSAGRCRPFPFVEPYPRPRPNRRSGSGRFRTVPPPRCLIFSLIRRRRRNAPGPPHRPRGQDPRGNEDRPRRARRWPRRPGPGDPRLDARSPDQPQRPRLPTPLPTPRGRLWRERTFYGDLWKPAQEASGLDIRPHECRHSYVTQIASLALRGSYLQSSLLDCRSQKAVHNLFEEAGWTVFFMLLERRDYETNGGAIRLIRRSDSLRGSLLRGPGGPPPGWNVLPIPTNLLFLFRRSTNSS